MPRSTTSPMRWSTGAGVGISLLGAILLLNPVGERDTAALITGGVVLAAAALEFLVGLRSGRAPIRRIELIMSVVTLGSALLILLRPGAYPLIVVATLCLVLRGMGAVAAAAVADGRARFWVLGRGVVDLGLALVLVAGVPLMAVISVISGVPWPPRGADVLANFVALSVLITGLSLIGVGFTRDERTA